MKIYRMIFSSLLFLACNSKQIETSAVNKKDTTSIEPQTNETKITSPAFTILPFDNTETTFKDSIKGTLLNGLSWQDAAGEHRVLFTAIPVQLNKNDLQSGAVNAYCFIKNGNAWKMKWVVKDKIDACQVDATCEFLPNSFTITDNDGNNVGEVTFLYKLSCKGDVSPDEKKLIMYEGLNKFAIRGTTVLEYAGNKQGGSKKIDAAFNKAAKPLLDFANGQWDKFGSTK